MQAIPAFFFFVSPAIFHGCPVDAVFAAVLDQVRVTLAAHCKSSVRLIRFEPEELLRGGEGIGVRTRSSGKLGERAGDEWRGLQIESGVGPAQHELIVQPLKIKARRRNARRIFDRYDVVSAVDSSGLSSHENIAVVVQRDSVGNVEAVRRPMVAVRPERHA